MRPFGYTVGFAAALTIAVSPSISAQQTPVGQRVFGPVPQPGETADDLPLPPGAFRINNAWTGPEPLRRVAPEWTPEAKIARLEGTAILTGIIDADGVPRDMRVTRSVGLGLDEKALAAIAQWRFVPAISPNQRIRVFTSIALDFRLPAGASRWHLTDAQFHLPKEIKRPSFKSTFYPAGAGISPDAVEEGQVVGASGRAAFASIAFEIDERGVPGAFEVSEASADVWGGEAIRVLRQWRFNPAMKDGHAIKASATFTLAWGQRELMASLEARQLFVSKAGVGQRLTPPGEMPPPVITEIAPDAAVVSAIVVSFVIDESGIPKDIHVTQPKDDWLDKAAVAAVSKLRLYPLVVRGPKQDVPMTVRVDFPRK
jgi:TonB family protein